MPRYDVEIGPTAEAEAATRHPLSLMVILVAAVLCGWLLAGCQQASVSHAACANGVRARPPKVTLRLSASLPYPSVRAQPGEELKIEVGYKGQSMTYPNVVGTSACLLRATRHSNGSVTAVVVAKSPGRSKIFATLNYATAAEAPELGGAVLVTTSRG